MFVLALVPLSSFILVTLCLSRQLGVSILWFYQALYTSGLSCSLRLPGCGTCSLCSFRFLSIISICSVPGRLKLVWAARVGALLSGRLWVR